MESVCDSDSLGPEWQDWEPSVKHHFLLLYSILKPFWFSLLSVALWYKSQTINLHRVGESQNMMPAPCECIARPPPKSPDLSVMTGTSLLTVGWCHLGCR